jgi:hypothetical protein
MAPIAFLVCFVWEKRVDRHLEFDDILLLDTALRCERLLRTVPELVLVTWQKKTTRLVQKRQDSCFDVVVFSFPFRPVATALHVDKSTQSRGYRPTRLE